MAPFPNAFAPDTMTVPAFNVKPPFMVVVKVNAPRSKVPALFLVMPPELLAVTV